MKKPLILLLGFLLSLPAWANMASPVQRGTATGLPFVSKYVNILHENLKITPSADFKTCRFEVVYDIFADTSGVSIPMLFVAENYMGEMQIWVDGLALATQRLPDAMYIQKASPLSSFSFGDHVEIEWEKGERRIYDLEDLHYFELDLAKGSHQIRVVYDAEVWRDRHDVVAKEYFPYALSPASNWKSFGQLDIVMDARKSPYPLTTNLGPPTSGDLANIAKWTFTTLPNVPTLVITAQPEISSTAQFFVDFGMDGFMWSSFALLGLIHLGMIWIWRKKNVSRKFSWVWLLGSFAVPFIAMVIYVMSEGWIDDIVGPAASRFGSYSFLIFIFYPVGLVGYGLVAFLFDLVLRKIYSRPS
jgi:hypothetical protein